MASPVQDCTADLPTSRAFLKLLRWLEHYPRDDDGVYWVTYGGGTFSDGKSHPNKRHTKWGHTSSAAGAYQIVVEMPQSGMGSRSTSCRLVRTKWHGGL